MTDYALMNQLLYEGKAPQVKEMTEKALAEGCAVEEILQNGLIAGMSVVGEDFKYNRLYVPQVLIDRPKMGFAVPIGQWFRNDFGSMRTLLLDQLRSREPFGPIPIRRAVVKQLLDEHLSRERDHGQRLFALLTLSIWAGL